MVHIEHLCNNKATIVTIGDNEFFFSYTTLIGFRGFAPLRAALLAKRPGLAPGRVAIRLKNSFSKTTERHMNELGIQDFEIIPNEDFATIIDEVA